MAYFVTSVTMPDP